LFLSFLDYIQSYENGSMNNTAIAMFNFFQPGLYSTQSSFVPPCSFFVLLQRFAVKMFTLNRPGKGDSFLSTVKILEQKRLDYELEPEKKTGKEAQMLEYCWRRG
jgi:hypothetical protein